MKTILIIMMLMITSISFAQSEKLEQSFTETLKPYVLKYLDKVDKGVDYAIEQTPVVLKQYVIYKATIAWLGVFLAFLILCFSKYIYNKHETLRDWDTPAALIPWFFGISGIIIFICNISIAIMTTWFSKLYLVKTFIESVN